MDLAAFNQLDHDDARDLALVWAAVPAWAEAIASARPFATVADLEGLAEALAAEWTVAELDAALAHHPRIGARVEGGDAESRHSRGEQAAVAEADATVRAAIAAGNEYYEARFDRVFLVRAAGRTPQQNLEQLDRRVELSPEDEVAEALAQLLEIALLRLRSAVIARARVTTHVLDAVSGTAAAGIAVSLADEAGPIADGVTDADGRLSIGPEQLPSGTYTLTFQTGPHFAAQGLASFHPLVAVAFLLDVEGRDHDHVPLLLSPFAYSTYRGT